VGTFDVRVRPRGHEPHFESMAPTLPPDTLFGLHGNAPLGPGAAGFFRSCTGSNVMSQRNATRIDSFVTPYFGSNVVPSQ